jgi:hypothetical protein
VTSSCRGEDLLSPYAARVSPFQWMALTAVCGVDSGRWGMVGPPNRAQDGGAVRQALRTAVLTTSMDPSRESLTWNPCSPRRARIRSASAYSRADLCRALLVAQ